LPAVPPTPPLAGATFFCAFRAPPPYTLAAAHATCFTRRASRILVLLFGPLVHRKVAVIVGLTAWNGRMVRGERLCLILVDDHGVAIRGAREGDEDAPTLVNVAMLTVGDNIVLVVNRSAVAGGVVGCGAGSLGSALMPGCAQVHLPLATMPGYLLMSSLPKRLTRPRTGSSFPHSICISSRPAASASMPSGAAG
jgi:hypothetical protein